MGPERGKWSSKDASTTFDNDRLMPWFGLTLSKSNIEHDEADSDGENGDVLC
jgi:hypothetical protein